MSQLRLSDQQPFGVGKQRVVYLHPRNADLVVKLPHDHVLERTDQKARSRFHKSSLFGHLSDTYSEVRAHLILYAAGNGVPRQVARFYGFADTDMGVGEVCELKKGRDGAPAPSLRSLLRSGCYGEAHQAAVARFIEWLLESNLTIKELHPGNLVYADCGAGQEEFVLVDGVGEKGQLALNSRFPLLNRRHKQKHIRVLMDKIHAESGRAKETAGPAQQL